jgi:hypothetical protein
MYPGSGVPTGFAKDQTAAEVSPALAGTSEDSSKEEPPFWLASPSKEVLKPNKFTDNFPYTLVTGDAEVSATSTT